MVVYVIYTVWYIYQDSSVGILAGSELDGSRIRVQFLGGQEILLFSTASGCSVAYPASCPIGTGGTGVLSLGVKQLRHEVNHTPPSSAN
jgi:hypothetical protein